MCGRLTHLFSTWQLRCSRRVGGDLWIPVPLVSGIRLAVRVYGAAGLRASGGTHPYSTEASSTRPESATTTMSTLRVSRMMRLTIEPRTTSSRRLRADWPMTT